MNLNALLCWEGLCLAVRGDQLPRRKYLGFLCDSTQWWCCGKHIWEEMTHGVMCKFAVFCIQLRIYVCDLSICGWFWCVFGYLVHVWLNTLTLVVQMWIPVRTVRVYTHLGCSSGDLIANLTSAVTGSMIYLGTPLNNTKVISIFFFLTKA